MTLRAEFTTLTAGSVTAFYTALLAQGLTQRQAPVAGTDASGRYLQVLFQEGIMVLEQRGQRVFLHLTVNKPIDRQEVERQAQQAFGLINPSWLWDETSL